MKKYVALYMAPLSAMDEMKKNSSPEQMKAGMDEWMKWANAHKKDLVELGAPLGKNKRMTSKGATDVRNEVSGFSIVQADSHEAATKLFHGNPHLKIPGGYIEVLEWVSLPGM